MGQGKERGGEKWGGGVGSKFDKLKKKVLCIEHIQHTYKLLIFSLSTFLFAPIIGCFIIQFSICHIQHTHHYGEEGEEGGWWGGERGEKFHFDIIFWNGQLPEKGQEIKIITQVVVVIDVVVPHRSSPSKISKHPGIAYQKRKSFLPAASFQNPNMVAALDEQRDYYSVGYYVCSLQQPRCHCHFRRRHQRRRRCRHVVEDDKDDEDGDDGDRRHWLPAGVSCVGTLHTLRKEWNWKKKNGKV